MNNIGCVVYTKIENGNIAASWSYEDNGIVSAGTGKGVLIASTDDLFGGHYDITYTSDKGKKRSFELYITKKSPSYELQWKKDDQVYNFGIGIINDHSLVVGWRQVELTEEKTKTSLLTCLNNWFNQLFG